MLIGGGIMFENATEKFLEALALSVAEGRTPVDEANKALNTFARFEERFVELNRRSKDMR
jgi:hypothetical protein